MTSSSQDKHARGISRVLALLLALALLAGACGSSDAQDAAPAEPAIAAADNADGVSLGGGSDAVQTQDTTDATAEEEAPAEATEAEGIEPAEGDSADAIAPPAGETKRSRMGDQLLVANRSVETGRFEGRLTIAGDPELPDGIELVFEGAYDTANQSSEIELDFAAIAMAAAEADGTDLGPFAAMLEEPMIVRTIGDRSFVSWGLLSLLTGGQGTWIESEADEADDLTSSFGASTSGSPTEFLSVLEDANADITEIGTEDVRGVSTTHIRALVDLAELDASLTDEDRATLERDLGDLDVSAFPIDFWIDDDGLIRRYAMDLDQSAAGGEGPTQASLVFEFFDYGSDVDIQVPPADQIISADELDLEGFGFGN